MIGAPNIGDIAGGDAGPATSGNASGGISYSGRNTVNISTGKASTSAGVAGWVMGGLALLLMGGGFYLATRKK